MRNNKLSPAVKNVFRRAMEAKKLLFFEDGSMPQEVRELCFPAPEISPEIIDEWNRSHTYEDELIDKFVLRNTFTGDFSTARIILLDNCVPKESPGDFSRKNSGETWRFWFYLGEAIKEKYGILKDVICISLTDEAHDTVSMKFNAYGKEFHSFSDFWKIELHTLENTGLLDAFYPVTPPVCPAEENYNLFKFTGRRGLDETRAKIAELEKYFAQIAWFTFDLEQFTRKRHYYNFGNENVFIKTPYYNYFKNIKEDVLEKVRRAMTENKVIICRNELALWNREIDFSQYDNFFYLYNPARPICRGNVGKGCDLSKRTAADPFDELINACGKFLK